MAGPLFECSWGDIRLFASRVDWVSGNTQVVHDLAIGDEHPVQTRGEQIPTATVELLFDDIPGVDIRGIDAFRAFEATKKERRIFTHPVSGSFFAKIGNFNPSLSPDAITATVEFIPDGTFRPVAPAGAGTAPAAGEDAVVAATQETAKAMAAAGVGFEPSLLDRLDFSKPIRLSFEAAFDASINFGISADLSANISASASATATASASASAMAFANASAFAFASAYASAFAFASVTAIAESTAMASAEAFAFAYASAAVNADAEASVIAWGQEEDITPARIEADVARLSESLEQLIDIGRLEEEVDMYPVFASVILLGESIRAAAISATAEAPTLFLMRVSSPTSLLPLAARIYGGSAATARSRQIEQLNNVRTPGWLEPGDYLMPQRPASRRPLLLGGE